MYLNVCNLIIFYFKTYTLPLYIILSRKFINLFDQYEHLYFIIHNLFIW